MKIESEGLVASGRRCLALAALLFVAACGQWESPAPKKLPSGEWLTFEGSWTATGTRRTLHLGTDHRAAIFDLTGSLLLTGEQRPAVGFQAQAIGFSDSRTGIHARSVWIDERGDKVYSELKGEPLGRGNYIVGTFIGGTGRYVGLTGEYTFQWQYIIESDDGEVSGRVVGLRGRAHLAAAGAGK